MRRLTNSHNGGMVCYINFWWFLSSSVTNHKGMGAFQATLHCSKDGTDNSGTQALPIRMLLSFGHQPRRGAFQDNPAMLHGGHDNSITQALLIPMLCVHLHTAHVTLLADKDSVHPSNAWSPSSHMIMLHVENVNTPCPHSTTSQHAYSCPSYKMIFNQFTPGTHCSSSYWDSTLYSQNHDAWEGRISQYLISSIRESGGEEGKGIIFWLDTRWPQQLCNVCNW